MKNAKELKAAMIKEIAMRVFAHGKNVDITEQEHCVGNRNIEQVSANTTHTGVSVHFNDTNNVTTCLNNCDLETIMDLRGAVITQTHKEAERQVDSALEKMKALAEENDFAGVADTLLNLFK